MFAELCAKSNFSFLEGASHPEEMVGASHELGQSALAIADRDGIYGLVRGFRAARDLKHPFISGAEFSLEYDEPASGPRPRQVLALVQNHAGYTQLCQLLTLAHRDHEKGTAGVQWQALAEHATGLTLVIPTDAPLLGLQAHHASSWGTGFWQAQEAFAGSLHVATYRALDGLDAARMQAAERLESLICAPIFATSRPLYHHASRKPLADVVACVRHKTTLARAGKLLRSNAEARLRTPAQMAALFFDHPEWVERTVEIAEGLRFSFSELRYRFPSAELCQGYDGPDELLALLVTRGLERRYGSEVPAGVRAQCDKELALIDKLGVAPYFLSVWDVVEMARKRRILCQGRGSAANSAVCFALGITAVDPARSNLLFERFLSAERAEPPDIDVDFEHERREEVIQDIYEKYGRDRAAMVCEVISYRGRSALREVSKAFDLSSDQQERLSSLVSHYQFSDITPEAVIEAGLDPKDVRLGKAIAMARAINGFPRHLSIHVGGFVISAEPLDRVAPIEPARMPNRTVIPWDKDDMETLGFFKIDVLGLGMLSCIRKCLALLAIERPTGKPFDPIDALAELPAEDEATYDAICRADTVGVFQIESRAQMTMLPRLKPRCFYDLVIEVAIVRPGPIQGGMVHPYLRRRQGKESARAPHPILEPILARTLGVPLFQEQVMQIAMTGAGYGAGEADQLRRDMASWKKHGRLEQHRERLLDGFSKRGISQEFGEALYKQIQGFGEYGFPESHAASFALLVYVSSYLKTHYPALFACALLNAQPMGFYSASSLVQDAQRHGVVVRSPSVLASDWDCTLEHEPGSSGDRALRLGLRQISGFGEEPARRIEAARADRGFESLGDLVRRADLKKNELDALAESGALDALSDGRRSAMWRVRAPRLEGLFAEHDLEQQAHVPELPAMKRVEQLLLDYGRLGLSIEDHPMRHVRPHLEGRGVLQNSELGRRRHGANVRVAGLIIGRQRPQTASGVTFISLEDETGVANLVVTVPIFERFRHPLLHGKMVLVEGKLEREESVVHVLVKRAILLELPQGAVLVTKSRDFH